MEIVFDVESVSDEFDEVHLLIARSDVEKRSYAPIRKYLAKFVDGDKTYRARSKLNIGFDGYDDDPREVWETVDIINWVWQSMDIENIPWFYLLSTDSEALSIKIIAMCYCAKLGNFGKLIVDVAKLREFAEKNFSIMDNYFGNNLPEEIDLEITQNINRYIGDWIGGKR